MSCDQAPPTQSFYPSPLPTCHSVGGPIQRFHSTHLLKPYHITCVQTMAILNLDKSRVTLSHMTVRRWSCDPT